MYFYGEDWGEGLQLIAYLRKPYLRIDKCSPPLLDIFNSCLEEFHRFYKRIDQLLDFVDWFLEFIQSNGCDLL